MKRFFLLITTIIVLGGNSLYCQRIIKADFNKSVGKTNTMYKECVGAGRANEGLRADWQQQLAIAHKECGFKFVRMHGLLTDDMGVYREDEKGNSEYNFQYVDALYDYIIEIGMKPFVELGFMPNALASGNQTLFWWRANVTPPKDYDKWKMLIQNLVQHFTDRYGVEEVKTWYFEVWNEPNLNDNGFWAGTQDEYYKLYKYAAEGVKAVNKDYKVGGPATAGAAWVSETIEFCLNNDVPIDFISTHTYGVDQGYLDEFGVSGTVLLPNKDAISGDVLNSRKQISESDMSNLELHYTEWNSSYTPADPFHDSYHSAAYILKRLKQVGNAAQSMSYWTFTDIFEEAGIRFTPFHGGFGLMNYQGIKKPAFFAYNLLNKLGDIELENSDASSWICKNNNGNVQILLWDYTYTFPSGDSVLNQTYYIRDLPAKSKGTVNVQIQNVEKGTYQLEIYKIGYRVNDAYTTYYDMGKPNQLTKAQVEIIKERNNGKAISSEIIHITNKKPFSKKLSINENDVIMLNLIKQ